MNTAYVAYDKEVVDSHIKVQSAGFGAADSLAIPTHFCSANEQTLKMLALEANGVKNKQTRETEICPLV